MVVAPSLESTFEFFDDSKPHKPRPEQTYTEQVRLMVKSVFKGRLRGIFAYALGTDFVHGHSFRVATNTSRKSEIAPMINDKQFVTLFIWRIIVGISRAVSRRERCMPA